MRVTLIITVMLALSMTARGEIRSESVEYKQGDTVLQGQLIYDDAFRDKRPGVLVVHEWWGLNDYARSRARQLAEIGYVAFAVDMYGKGVGATTVDGAAKLSGALKGDRKLLRQRIQAAMDTLKTNPRVEPTKIACMGYCFGGTVSLELARSGADVAGVVSFHGALDTPTPEDAKNIKGRVLVCHGVDDPFVPHAQLTAFIEEMNGGKANYEIDAYGGAVHGFTNPVAGNAGIQGMAYNGQADRRSWESMKQFFEEIFKK